MFSTLSLAASLLLSSLFKEWLIFYLGIPFAVSLFFLFTLLNRGRGGTFKAACPLNPETLLMVLSILCVILVLAVPTFDVPVLEWIEIPPLSWLRYISALFLTSFLPGYLILRVVNKEGEIKGCTTIVLSYLLSLFLSSLAGFLILLSSSSISALGLPAIIVMDLMLLAIYYLKGLKTSKRHSLDLNLLELGATLPVFVGVMLGSLAVMLSNMPLTSGDTRWHCGYALQFYRGLPVYAGRIIAYPYLFHVYLAMVFALSGIHPALAEQGLYIISFMPVLAFYSAMKAWFPAREDKTPVVATFLSTLLGFGGLCALYLRLTYPGFSTTRLLGIATSRTYDIYMRIPFLPDTIAPLWYVGLPVLYTLLYFLRKDAYSHAKRVFVPILTALGWLSHVAEPIIFTFMLLIYALFFRRSGEGKFAPYMMLGLLLVAMVDIAAPVQFYLRSAGGAPSIPFYASLSLLALIIIIEAIEDKLMVDFSTKLKTLSSKRLERAWRFGRWMLLYAYFFLSIVWLAVVKDFNLWEWGGYDSVPFFVLPLRFGAVGLIAIITAFLYLTKIVRNRVLLFFLTLIPLGFTLEQAASYGLLPYYPASRYATVAFVGALAIAAFGMVTLTKSTSRSLRSMIVLCITLTLLAISSQLSTSLFYVNASYYSRHEISRDELDALNYIRQHLSSNSSVLTFTADSASKVRDFAGVSDVQSAQRWSDIILSTSNPYIITYVLGSSNVKYIYVSQKDAELLGSNSILASMINYFPKVLENSYVKIYEVPPLTPPSPNASLGVLHLPPSIQRSEDGTRIEGSSIEGWALHEKYGNALYWGAQPDGGVLKVSVTSGQEGTVWVSYLLPLAIKTKNSMLSFRYKVGNKYTWFTIMLHNTTSRCFFHTERLTDRVFTTKTFPLPDNQTITGVEIVVGTTDRAPVGTSATAYLDYIKITQRPFNEDDVLPALLVALLRSKYSFIYADATMFRSLDKYLPCYTCILLTSDPKTSMEDLVRWVLAGNSLIVLNTRGDGFFASLLGATNSLPPLSVRELGLGKIVYVNLKDNKSKAVEREFIEKIRESLALSTYVHKVELPAAYNSSLGVIEVDGDLSLRTDALKLQGPLRLINPPFQLDEPSEVDVFGEVTLTFKNSSLYILPSNSCLVIKPKDYALEGEVSIKGRDTFVYSGAKAINDLRAPASFRFKLVDASLNARLPAVNACGAIIFDQLYVPPTGVAQREVEIQGCVKFDTLYISDDMLLIFSTFKADGKILSLGAMAASKPTIPWAEVLTSSYNTIFNVFFLLIAVIYTLEGRSEVSYRRDANGR
jgi:hypothetical protein